MMNRISPDFPVVLLLLISLLAAGCHAVDDEVLAVFPRPELLHPEDSVDLSEYDILLPEDVARYGDGYFIKHHSQKYSVDYVEPSSGQMFHCFHMGRGPQEVIRPSSFHYQDDTLFVYDISLKRLYWLKASASVRARTPEVGVYCSFSVSGDPSVNRPFILAKEGNTLVATGLFDDPAWFGILYSSSGIISGIGFVDYDAIKDFPDVSRHALFLSTNFSVRPDGKKLVAALQPSAAISICSLSDSSLVEEKRMVFYGPSVTAPAGRYDPVISYNPDSRTAFCCVCSDSESIYLLYSGRTFAGDVPNYECNFLLQMDWAGNPVKSYMLSSSINSFCLEDSKIYGVSSHPDSRLYVYSLK